MKYVLITGVSTGIGKGILEVLVKNDFYVFGTVRSSGDAKKVSEEIDNKNFHPLIVDVSHDNTIDSAVKSVKKVIGDQLLYGLINNAGILEGGPFVHLSLDKYRKVMEVNFFGALKMMNSFIPLMASEKSKNPMPRIINISSVLGHYGLPYLSTYIASKYAIEGFSDSVRLELEKLRIKLVLLIPGAVKSRIFEKGAKKEYEEIHDTIFSKPGEKLKQEMLKLEEKGMNASKVGRKILSILNTSNPNPRYRITGNPMVEWFWPKYLPDKLLDYALRKIIG
jgi:hypothetical protein